MACNEITDEELVKQARECIMATGEDFDDAVFSRLARRLSYVPGNVSDDALYGKRASSRRPPPRCHRPVQS